jgi:hypothetical protein
MHLGALAYDRGELDESRYLLAEAAEIMRELGDTWLLGLALCALGLTALARGEAQAARQAYADVLKLVRMGETGLTLDLACGLAALLDQQGRDDEALALLIALAGAGGEHTTAQRAASLRADIEGRLSQARRAAAAARARDRPLLPWLEELCAR